MSFATLATKIWHTIIDAFKQLKEEERKLIPIAVSIVQGVKTIEDSPLADIIAKALGHEQGAEWLAKAKEATIKAVIALDVLKAASEIQGTDEEKAQYILAKVKLADDDGKNAFYHNLASLLIKIFADGKVSWSEGIEFAEAYYKGHIAA